MRAWLLVGMAIFCTACGSTTTTGSNNQGGNSGGNVTVSSDQNGTATFNGNLQGQHLTPMDATFLFSQNASDENAIGIIVTSTPNACTDAKASIGHQNETLLALQIFATSSGEQIIGTPQTIGPYTTSSALFLTLDANCTENAQSGSGTVTVTSLAGNVATGTFDLSFEYSINGSTQTDSVSGTFSASACNVPNPIAEAGSFSCQP